MKKIIFFITLSLIITFHPVYIIADIYPAVPGKKFNMSSLTATKPDTVIKYQMAKYGKDYGHTPIIAGKNLTGV